MTDFQLEITDAEASSQSLFKIITNSDSDLESTNLGLLCCFVPGQGHVKEFLYRKLMMQREIFKNTTYVIF